MAFYQLQLGNHPHKERGKEVAPAFRRWGEEVKCLAYCLRSCSESQERLAQTAEWKPRDHTSLSLSVIFWFGWECGFAISVTGENDIF